MKEYCILLNDFSALVKMIMYIFPFLLLMWDNIFINFHMLEQPDIPGMNAGLVE
jgi:hypothetical protein